ncbi:MAG: AI-2E family transporter [Candidatus Aenigmatarchaeota archaeon]
MDDRRLKMAFASVTLAALILFLVYAMLPYTTAFFGAIIFYSLFRPFYKALLKARLSAPLAAITVIILSIIIVLVPLFLLFGAVYGELTEIAKDKVQILGYIQEIDNIVPGLQISASFSQELAKFGASLSTMFFSTAFSVGAGLINIVLMYFLLYYLFTGEDKFRERACNFSPFNCENTRRLMKEFKNITYTTVAVSGIIAILQGALLGIGFYMFGIGGALVWGFAGAILSFLPVIGTPIIWIPTAVYLFFQQSPLAGIAFLLWGLFISTIDNFIRPVLQKKIGNIHPLISLLGVFMGIPIFGLLGVIIGPLLLSYLLLMIRMYREEYMSK